MLSPEESATASSAGDKRIVRGDNRRRENYRIKIFPPIISEIRLLAPLESFSTGFPLKDAKCFTVLNYSSRELFFPCPYDSANNRLIARSLPRGLLRLEFSSALVESAVIG